MLVAAALQAPTGHAATPAECALVMAGTETEARRAFEAGLAELIAGVAPDQAALAGRVRDLQLLRAQDMFDRIAHLAAERPLAVEAEGGAIAWSAEDDAGYMADTAHAARTERIARLEGALADDPGRADLQALIRNVVSRLFEFQRLRVDLDAARSAAAAAFAACRAG